MGRRRKGPVQLNGGDTWYARLWVPEKDRKTAGKGTLIRSLKTTNHSEALKRYGAAYSELEKELAALMKPKGLQDLREHVEANRGYDDNPAILTDLLVGFDEPNPTQKQMLVYEALKSGQQIPLNWQEAIELWVSVRNREKARPITQKSIDEVKRCVKSIEAFGQPSDISKDIVRGWINQQELRMQPGSVKAGLKKLSAVLSVLVQTDHLEVNPFTLVVYKVTQNRTDAKREFTDEELKIIQTECPDVFSMCLTSLRPGELASRLSKDLKKDMLIIDDQPTVMINETEHWRPKTESSYRRVPVPPCFSLTDPSFKVQTKKEQWQRKIKRLFNDKTCTPHSGRHTYYTLARRAGCDTPTMEAIAGHSSESGSKTAQEYGRYTDDARRREIQKLWDFVERITS